MVVVRPRPTRGWCLKDTKARGVSAASCGDRPAENGMSTVANEDEEMLGGGAATRAGPPPQGVAVKAQGNDDDLINRLR